MPFHLGCSIIYDALQLTIVNIIMLYYVSIVMIILVLIELAIIAIMWPRSLETSCFWIPRLFANWQEKSRRSKAATGTFHQQNQHEPTHRTKWLSHTSLKAVVTWAHRKRGILYETFPKFLCSRNLCKTLKWRDSTAVAGFMDLGAEHARESWLQKYVKAEQTEGLLMSMWVCSKNFTTWTEKQEYGKYGNKECTLDRCKNNQK